MKQLKYLEYIFKWESLVSQGQLIVRVEVCSGAHSMKSWNMMVQDKGDVPIPPGKSVYWIPELDIGLNLLDSSGAKYKPNNSPKLKFEQHFVHGVLPVGQNKKGRAQTRRDNDIHQSRERRICKENHGVQKAVFEKMACMCKNLRKWWEARVGLRNRQELRSENWGSGFQYQERYVRMRKWVLKWKWCQYDIR